MLQYEYLVANSGFDMYEIEPSKMWGPCLPTVMLVYIYGESNQVVPWAKRARAVQRAQRRAVQRVLPPPTPKAVGERCKKLAKSLKRLQT